MESNPRLISSQQNFPPKSAQKMEKHLQISSGSANDNVKIMFYFLSICMNL